MYDNVEEIVKALEKKILIDWKIIPDFGLYMEQVLGVLNGSVLEKNAITANMINNYVKDGYIRHPEQKKYARDQLVRLLILMQIKSVLSIPEIASSIDRLGFCDDFYEIYEHLKNKQQDFLHDFENRISIYFTEKKGSKAFLALQLSLEACLLRSAAELLLSSESDQGSAVNIET